MRALPEDVLVKVLRHVDQAERLASCALVSTAWAKAAAVATDDFKIHTIDFEPFMPWLQHHGSHVTSFTSSFEGDSNDKGLLSMLPCKNLQELTLVEWWVSLGPSEDGPGILHAATGLTSLHLKIGDHEELLGGLLSLTALHALPALQHFDMYVGDTRPSDNDEYADQLPSCVISGLTTLTRLRLSGVLALESLQPFSCLTKLQHLTLDLDLVVADTADAVQSEQQPFKQLHALTYLSMQLHGVQLVSTSSSPAFSGCLGLQELHLHSAMVDASVFQGLTGLRVLDVTVFDVVKDAKVGGAAALLRHTACMQQLQCLMLVKGRFRSATVALRDAEAAACGAVTASKNLKRFDVSGLSLPRAAWVHLLPPSRRLLQLHSFELCFGGTGAFDCSALKQLVDCCPAITKLSFQNLLLFKQDVSLAPLLRLQQLSWLECPSVVDGAASVGVLARLTSLKRLYLRASPGLTEVGLLQLTALTGLQELRVGTAGWDRPWRKTVALMQGQHDLQFEVSTLQRL
jgi:hypothetical protein